MEAQNICRTIEQAKKNLEYAVNLYNCIEMPLDEKIIAFAEQDETATAYRNLALQKLKGENVEGRIFTAKNSALDRFYRWKLWIRKYEEGKAEGIVEGELKKARETARNLLSMDLATEQIATATGLSIEEIELLKNNKC
jgi:predicted transposase/invertase (TIGR01784 family)